MKSFHVKQLSPPREYMQLKQAIQIKYCYTKCQIQELSKMCIWILTDAKIKILILPLKARTFKIWT